VASVEPRAEARLPKPPKELETDQARLATRQKQIDYGKNTVGYDNYLKLCAKEKRGRDSNRFPLTPDKTDKCSKRAFDGRIKVWRRALHTYDEEADKPGAAGLPPPSSKAPPSGADPEPGIKADTETAVVPAVGHDAPPTSSEGVGEEDVIDSIIMAAIGGEGGEAEERDSDDNDNDSLDLSDLSEAEGDAGLGY